MVDALLPDAPPVNPPVTPGALHAYTVPAGTIPFVPFTGVTLNKTPLQLVPVIALITAVGFTVTVTVNVDPVQLPDNGVTVYVAVCVVFVGLVNNPLILTAVVPLTPPVIPPVTPGALQLYVVPTGMIPFVPFVGVIVKLTPLHVVFVIAVTCASGFRFTVTEKDAPVHDPDTGVTIYVAVTTPIVVFVKVPVMELTPTPCEAPPVNPLPVGALHVYVVPAGTIPFVPFTGLTVNNTPPHPVVLIGVITAVGLIVTVTVNVAFTPHDVEVGVTVYVAVCTVFVGFVKLPVIPDAPLPVPPPVILPVTLGALHAYVVPAGTTPFIPFVGVTPKLTPLHDTPVIALTIASGFRFTVTEKDAPVHDPDTGVTIYVAVTTPIVVFVKVPVMELTPTPCEAPPVNPLPVGALHVYVVPAGTIPFVPFTGLTVNNTPPHPVVLIGVITAVGLIVTVNVNVAFAPHKVDVGVTVYVAVC